MNESNNPNPARKRGCFFYGCLTCVVLALIVCLMAFLAVRYVKNQVALYTDSAPVALPKVEMADAEFAALQQRLKAFGDAMDQKKPSEPLLLSGNEINALLLKTLNVGELSDKVQVSVSGDQVKGQVSIPLSGLGWLGRGRYLNGEATFKVSLENGVLIVTADSVKVKGKPLPETFMGALRQENLAKDAYRDPKNAEVIRKLESIKVENGNVIIKARESQ